MDKKVKQKLNEMDPEEAYDLIKTALELSDPGENEKVDRVIKRACQEGEGHLFFEDKASENDWLKRHKNIKT